MVRNVCEVSVKSALIGLQKSAGGGKQFAALQTLWAHHASTNMDSRIVRGAPKKITGREHLSVAEYRESVEAEKAIKAEIKGQRSTVLNSLAFIAQRDEEAKTREAHLRDRQKMLDGVEETLVSARATVATRATAIDGWERTLDERDRALERTRREVIATAAKKEEERRAEHEAAQRRQIEAELAARSATVAGGSPAATYALEILAQAESKEEELKVRACKQKLAEEAYDRREQDLSLSCSGSCRTRKLAVEAEVANISDRDGAGYVCKPMIFACHEQ